MPPTSPDILIHILFGCSQLLLTLSRTPTDCSTFTSHFHFLPYNLHWENGIICTQIFWANERRTWWGDEADWVLLLIVHIPFYIFFMWIILKGRFNSWILNIMFRNKFFWIKALFSHKFLIKYFIIIMMREMVWDEETLLII